MPSAPALHSRPGPRPQPVAAGSEPLRKPEARPRRCKRADRRGGGRRAAAGPRLPRRRRRRRRRSAFLNGTCGQHTANREARTRALGEGGPGGAGPAGHWRRASGPAPGAEGPPRPAQSWPRPSLSAAAPPRGSGPAHRPRPQRCVDLWPRLLLRPEALSSGLSVTRDLFRLAAPRHCNRRAPGLSGPAAQR